MNTRTFYIENQTAETAHLSAHCTPSGLYLVAIADLESGEQPACDGQCEDCDCEGPEDEGGMKEGPILEPLEPGNAIQVILDDDDIVAWNGCASTLLPFVTASLKGFLKPLKCGIISDPQTNIPVIAFGPETLDMN